MNITLGSGLEDVSDEDLQSGNFVIKEVNPYDLLTKEEIDKIINLLEIELTCLTDSNAPSHKSWDYWQMLWGTGGLAHDPLLDYLIDEDHFLDKNLSFTQIPP